MMGIQQKQGELWAKAVDLGSRMPEDHLLRQIDRFLDLSFVRERVAHLYGKNGNVSVDPVVIMRMMILLFVDNLRSERELMRQIPLRIDYLWFLGYGLDDEVPNHSVLSKARKRWGKAVFDELFGRVVLQCVEADLVGSEKVHIDSSLIRADASLASVVKTLVGEEIEKLEEIAKATDAPRPKHKPINTRYRSTTDPDSRVVRHDGGKAKPCFKNHRVVDDKAGVTTAVATTHGVENDGNKLMDMLEEHEERTGEKPETAVADCCYGDIENFVALADKDIKAHVGDLGSRLRNKRTEGIFPAEDFRYDQETDTFECPAGQRLHRHHFMKSRGHWEYRTKRGTCNDCPLKDQCTRAKAGRTLKRHEHQEKLDLARGQSHSEEAREDRKRRQWFQERNFGEAALMHGFKRARWRGLEKQSIQDLLIATIQNLKILARRSLWALICLTISPLRAWKGMWRINSVVERIPRKKKLGTERFHSALEAPTLLRFSVFRQQPVVG